MPLTIRRSALSDLKYIDGLRRRESESLGFLPALVYEQVVTRAMPLHRLWLAEVNGDPVGFLYASPGLVGKALRIIQVCTQPDARRLEYAAALVAEAERYAAWLQRPAVGCHVATDIEATEFWNALGYPVMGTLLGGSKRKRVLEDRRKVLSGGLF